MHREDREGAYGITTGVQLRDSATLIRAFFPQTTRPSVLQALVLFLMPCQFLYDSLTFWILTAVAIRMG